MFKDCPAYLCKVVLTSRIIWFTKEDGTDNPSTNHAWFVWDWSKPADDKPFTDYHFRTAEETTRKKVKAA
jgi:hypothetical protein